MQTTLCVFLVDDSVSACCMEGDFTVSAVYSQPVKAILVEENGNGKLIPGFNDQDVAGLLSSYCSLSNIVDYLKPPIILGNEDPSVITSMSITRHVMFSTPSSASLLSERNQRLLLSLGETSYRKLIALLSCACLCRLYLCHRRSNGKLWI